MESGAEHVSLIFLFNRLSRLSRLNRHLPSIRVPFRPHSFLSGVAARTTCSLAAGGYRLALEAA